MCPACQAPLLVYELNGVEIDHCPDCLGTWLDAGELASLANAAGADAAALGEALDGAGRGRRTDRRCLRCRRRLREVTAGPAGDIQVDRCPHGHGLWFDRGEMATLIGQYGDGDTGDAAVSRFFADLYRSEITPET